MIVLDGSPTDAPRAKAAAAATIVRNCDVLLLAGDARSEPASSVVRLATGLGIPVLWLAPGIPVRLLLDPGWQLGRTAPLEGPAAWDALLGSLRGMLARPAATVDGGAAFLDATLPPHRLWHTHRWAMERLWRTAPTAELAEAPSAGWAGLYTAADRLAAGYADRYRSSYTLVLALAALALIAAVLGLGLPRDETGQPLIHPFWTALPEAACLAAIILIVRTNSRSGWQSRLIACRLLAELCRKQAALSLLARSLPASRIARLTEEGDLGWLRWRFAAAVRAARLPSGVLAGPGLAAARDAAAAILLRGQRAYHAARAEANRRREHNLVRLGGWAFALTVGCVAIKLALLTVHSERAETFGLIAALLPAGAAALFGLRSYAELDLLVRQSERMIAVLDAAADSLGRTDTDRPGASQHIGDVLEEAAGAMLADVEGWIQISRVKAVEAG